MRDKLFMLKPASGSSKTTINILNSLGVVVANSCKGNIQKQILIHGLIPEKCSLSLCLANG
ncbi:hypothetical protein [Prevotella dentasini]|uniref:hypothetical protein n=1 Tax=Prevotella dentasini TaxID=589537 RepID=UPI0011DD11C5|nr:hypothetical protein [Prevotella dentasini]